MQEKTVYEYQIEVPFGTTVAADWTATKTRIARNPPATATILVPKDLGQITGSYTYPFAPNPNCEYRNGLLKRISHYDNANNPVQQVDYNYASPANLSKVYALRLELGKAPITFTKSRTLNGQHILDEYTQPQSMFIYSRYEINTNVTVKLQSITTRSFDQGNPAGVKTDIKNFEYSGLQHDFVTKTTSIGSDGVEYTTNYLYPADYSLGGEWTQMDNATKAIDKLKDKNIILPIETWVTKKEGSENAAVISANLAVFEYDAAQDNVYVKRSYSTSSRDPFISFVPSSVTISGGSSVFTYEAAKYIKYRDELHHDANGNARSSQSSNRAKASVHTFSENGVTQIAISNALADQVVFSDFEGSTGYDFASTGNSTVAGRYAGNGLNLLAGASRKLSSTLKKGDGNRYVFSCWVKTSSAGILYVRVGDGVHTQATSSINYANTNGTWKYYNTVLNTAAFNTQISVETESSGSINIDDVAFYPGQGEIAYFLYGPGFLKIAETDTRGVSSFFNYDPLGRLRYVRDQDLNITKSISYLNVSKVESRFIGVSLVRPFENFVNEPSELVISPNYIGAAYKVKIVSLIDHQANPLLIDDFSSGNVLTLSVPNFSYTFSTAGAWVAKVQITYQGTIFTSDQLSVITIGPRPFTVEICANRPAEIDLCAEAPLVTGCVSGSNGLTLMATASNGTAPYSYSWSYDNYPAGTASTLNVLSYQFPRLYRCEITDATGNRVYANFQINTYRSNPGCAPVGSEN